MQATFERSVAEQQAAGLSVPNVEGSVQLPPALPVVKMVLIGGPCSGKGTIGPLLSQALRSRVVSVGNLLRGEVRSGTRRGQQVREVMGRGELLEDQLVLELVRSRVTGMQETALIQALCLHMHLEQALIRLAGRVLTYADVCPRLVGCPAERLATRRLPPHATAGSTSRPLYSIYLLY
jgi:hypothetical protein